MSHITSFSSNLSYQGVLSPTPPNLVIVPRAPTTGDYIGYQVGDFWLFQQESPTVLQELWQLVMLGYQTAKWVQIYPISGTDLTFLTDSGDASPNALGDIGLNGGSNINTVAVGPNTIQVNLNNDVIISGYFQTTGGILALPNTTGIAEGTITIGGFSFISNYLNNTYVGLGAGNFTSSGTGNAFFGYNAGEDITTGIKNTAIGNLSGVHYDHGANNTSLGYQAGFNIVDGSFNIAIGSQAGIQWTGGSESNNIALGSAGVTGDDGVIRIGGGTGSSSGEQNKTFISGISNNVLDGQMGVMVINTATGGGGTIDNLGIIEPQANGYVLTSTGPTTPPEFLPASGGGGGGGGGIVIKTYDTAGTYVFTPSPSAISFEIYMWGGGGSGGSATVGSNGGSGGGFLKWEALRSSFGTTIPVVVGAGAAGVTAPSNGFTGGNTSFGNFNPINGGTGGSQQGTPTYAVPPSPVYDGSQTVTIPSKGAFNFLQGGTGGLEAGNAPNIGFTTYTTTGSGTGFYYLASQNAGGGGGGSVSGGTGGTGANLVDFQGNIILAGGGGGTSIAPNGLNGNDFVYTSGAYGGLLAGGTGGGGASGTGTGGAGGSPGGGGGGSAGGTSGAGADGMVIIIQYLAGGTGISFDGDTGTAVPNGSGVININGDGSLISTSATGNDITVIGSPGGLKWNNIVTNTPTTVTIVPNNGYILTQTAGVANVRVTLNLPTTAAVGSIFSVVSTVSPSPAGYTTNFTIQASGSQYFHSAQFGLGSLGGTCTAANAAYYPSVTFICTIANTAFKMLSYDSSTTEISIT